MRELVFALEYDPGCNRVADTLAAHPEARIRSLSLHATTERLWRVDHATGTSAALEDIADAFLTADYYADCLATQDCGATQETQVLDHTDGTLVLYSYWERTTACASVPHIALDHLGDGVMFDTRHEGRHYTWRLIHSGSGDVALDYAGIDLIRQNDDWCVLEANPTAGFKGFFGATGTSPAPHIARLAVETVGGQVDDVQVEELAHTLDDSVPACKPTLEDGPTDSQPVGFTEEIVVNGTRDSTTVVAKADTGAKRTSIDTEIAATIGAGPVIDTVRVTSGTQRTRQVRPVVEIQLQLGEWWHTVTVSIEDRSHMEYPVLLGRDVLTGHQVDLERRANEE